MILNEQIPSKDDKIEIYFDARFEVLFIVRIWEDLNKFHTSNGM